MSVPVNIPLFFASDHAGADLQNILVQRAMAHHWHGGDNVQEALNQTLDYPLVVSPVIQSVQQKQGYGVLICGSGIGMSIAANRFVGIRAALCLTPAMAQLARQHNDANILVLGARLMTCEIAWDCILRFVETPCEQDRHARRRALLDTLTL
jgi:ribose 5-phosphate isomerase B